MAKEEIRFTVREISMGGQSLLEGRKGSDKVLPFISIQVPTEVVYMLAAAPAMYEALKAAIQFLRHPKATKESADAERRKVYEVVQAALSLASPEKNTPPT